MYCPGSVIVILKTNDWSMGNVSIGNMSIGVNINYKNLYYIKTIWFMVKHNGHEQYIHCNNNMSKQAESQPTFEIM